MYSDDGIYHIFNRGAHRYSVFRKEPHYRKCIEFLGKYSAKYDTALIAFCLMPNHYHMMVQQNRGGSISRFLQTTFNAYVQYFNTLEAHSGTMFQGPAKSKLVGSEAQLMRTVAYIHTNPVRAKLVRKPEEWAYSDYRIWTGVPTVDHPINVMRDQLAVEGKAYEEFVRAYLLEGDIAEDWDRP